MKMKKTDVLIIGGSAAGIVAAVSGKMSYPNKKFTVVRNFEKSLVPCGIPYMFGTLNSSDKNVIADNIFKSFGIDLIVENINSIDRKKKFCHASSGDIKYDKLVIATGSNPKIPKWLKGHDLGNVFVISKEKSDLDGVRESLKDKKNIVVVGGGFIGIEMADELIKKGKKVSVVEILPHVLGAVFDDEICEEAERLLKKSGVRLLTGKGIKEIIGNKSKKVKEVLLDDGKKIKADAVILSMGYSPETILAKDAGLKLNERGFIVVDQFQRTSDKDIFAAGDCSEKKDFITKKTSYVMLSSVATHEARIVGMNLYSETETTNKEGILPVFSTWVVKKGFGAAGLSEKMAKKAGYDVVYGEGTSPDKHPATLPDMRTQSVKLIIDKKTNTIIGAECIGGESTGELTNVLGLIIQRKMTVFEVLNMQIGTQPLLTAPPTSYPIIGAAVDAIGKLKHSH